MVVEKPNQISWQEWDSSKPVRLCINVVSRDLFLSFPYRYWNFCSFFYGYFQKRYAMHEESLKLWRSRIALNLVSPNKTMRFFLPQDKRSRNVRKRDEGSMLFTRTSILYTQESARVRSRFSVKGTVKRLFSPRKRNVFLYLPKSRGGVWMWTAAVWESEFERKKHWILKNG